MLDVGWRTKQDQVDQPRRKPTYAPLLLGLDAAPRFGVAWRAFLNGKWLEVWATYCDAIASGKDGRLERERAW